MSTLRAAARRIAVAACLAAAGCAYEVGYDPSYVPAERPGFVADGRLLLVIPQEQRVRL